MPNIIRFPIERMNQQRQRFILEVVAILKEAPHQDGTPRTEAECRASAEELIISLEKL